MGEIGFDSVIFQLAFLYGFVFAGVEHKTCCSPLYHVAGRDCVEIDEDCSESI